MTELRPEKDRRYLVDLLLALEQRFAVNELEHDGVRLWPLVRLQIGRRFKRADPVDDAGLGAATAAAAGAPAAYPANAAQRRALIRDWRKRAAAAAKSPQRRLEAQWRRLRDSGPSRFLILSKVEKYYQLVDSKRYAPILDPVHEDLAQRGRTLTVALEPMEFACVNEPVRVDIEPQMAATAAWPPFRDAAMERELERLNAVIAEINPDFVISVPETLRRFHRWQRRMPFFERLFETMAPEAVFLSSFTGWIPAIWAARRLGVPTVDVQHGGQTAVHHPTTHYGSVPPEGYHFLPDYFWVWGELNRSYIAPWLPGGAVRHVPVVGGNRNVAKWFRDRDEGRLADGDAAFVARLGGRRDLVLVTLSYAVDRLLPDALAEAVRRTPDLHWLIRLHPNHRTRETRDQLAGLLGAAGCRNFCIDGATEVRLHTALSVAAHHVTPFSTAGREASAFGLRTTVCHPIGARMFAEEIDGGVFDYAEDADAIVASVRRDLAQTGKEHPGPGSMIEVSENAVDALLARVLEEPRSPAKDP